MRAAENRMASARTAFDAHRQIAQLALGQAPTPRDPGGGPSTAMSGIAGALSGAGALASLGPMGALAGGAIGGIAGLLGGK
jgi:hypothetical protein